MDVLERLRANDLPLIDFAPWPVFEEDEIEAAARVLRSGRVNYWTGEEGRAFENEIAELAGTKHGVALSNGTVALEVALRSLGIGPGDEVVVTPRSFVASAATVVLCGGTPVFADVDPDSGNLSAATIEPALTSRTKAILLVHLAGWPCDMDPILRLAESKGIAVIEDCAQAHGATYQGRPVGSFGQIAAWSFCQDKIITTAGEGGAVTTNREDLWSYCWSYKDHGKSFDAVHNMRHKPGFRWLHESFGTNMRMTEVQAAQGRVALKKLPVWIEARRRNARALAEAFAGLDALRVPAPPFDSEHAYYKFYAYVRPEALRDGWNRDRIMIEAASCGVPCYSGSCSEIYLEKAFQRAGFTPAEPLPTASRLGETSLMFLVHPTLSQGAIDRTCEVIAEIAREATR